MINAKFKNPLKKNENTTGINVTRVNMCSYQCKLHILKKQAMTMLLHHSRGRGRENSMYWQITID